jgi:hypothetical protein
MHGSRCNHTSKHPCIIWHKNKSSNIEHFNTQLGKLNGIKKLQDLAISEESVKSFSLNDSNNMYEWEVATSEAVNFYGAQL